MVSLYALLGVEVAEGVGGGEEEVGDVRRGERRRIGNV